MLILSLFDLSDSSRYLRYLIYSLIFNAEMLLREYWTIGKRLFKLKTVSSKDGSRPSFITLIIRSYLGMMVFPVEALALLFTNRRLCDAFFHTNVIISPPKK